MAAIPLTLGDETLAALRRYAAERGVPVDAVVEEALQLVLPGRLSGDEWYREWVELAERIRARRPTMSSEEVERDITRAREEARWQQVIA